TGGAHFAAPVSYAGHGRPVAIAVADMNGDGHPDIVLASSSYGDVSVLAGKGDGTFVAAVHHVVTSATASSAIPNGFAIGDVNGDGRLDIVVTDRANDGVTVMLANGTGGFDGVAYYREDAGPQAVAIGDLDGDGRPEIVVANHLAGDVGVFV